MTNEEIILNTVKDGWFYEPDTLEVVYDYDRRVWYVFKKSNKSRQTSVDDYASAIQTSSFIVDFDDIARALSDSNEDGGFVSCLKVELELFGETVERYVIPSQLYINTKSE